MPVLSLRLPYDLNVKFITITFNSHSVEMQIIWLLEVFVAYLYKSYPLMFKPSHNKEIINVSIDDLVMLYTKEFNVDTKYIKEFITLLCDYRNNYVHKGPLVAKGFFDDLSSTWYTELDNIASKFDLKLNWGFCIYDNYSESVKDYIEENKTLAMNYVRTKQQRR